MSEFIDVAAADEVGEGQMLGFTVDGHDLLVAQVGGAFYISDAHCPHLHAKLYKGSLEGTVVTCPLHHSQFDLTDGRVVRWTDWSGVAKSMAELTRHPRPLRVYEASVVDGRILVGPEKSPAPVAD